MRHYHILNLGAGVQSTTLYLMILDGELPIALDCAIFADTQEEPQTVYDHLAWLQSLGGPPIHVRTKGKLGHDLLHGQGKNCRFASIPAFTAAEQGKPQGMIRRQCTAEYKIEVVEKFIRRELLGLAPRKHVPKEVQVTQYFGLSYDEPGRCARVRGRFNQVRWGECRFPLFEDELTRSDCVAWLSKRVPHAVPRSACVFCPYKSNHEWKLLRDNDPSGWRRAVEIDEALRNDAVASRGLDQRLYVHRSCIPLAQVTLDENKQALYEMECEGGCGL